MADEGANARPADLEQLMKICNSFQGGDLADALMRARQLALAHPDLPLGWAMLALTQGSTVDERGVGQ